VLVAIRKLQLAVRKKIFEKAVHKNVDEIDHRLEHSTAYLEVSTVFATCETWPYFLIVTLVKIAGGKTCWLSSQALITVVTYGHIFINIFYVFYRYDMAGVGLLYRTEEGEREKEYLVYEAIFSLENFTVKISAIMPSPSYLGHLGRCNTNRSDSICDTQGGQGK
jgi:hypothetical protein